MNWFRARGEISAAIVEGFNNKAKLTTRKAYGFRSYRCLEIALYHTLGQLPESETPTVLLKTRKFYGLGAGATTVGALTAYELKSGKTMYQADRPRI